MTRCLSPVKHRHHHTWPWASGVIGFVILGLIGGCTGSQDTLLSDQPPATPPSPPPEHLAVPTDAAASAPENAPESAPDNAGTGRFLASLSSPAPTLLAASHTVQARARRLVIPTDPVAVDLYTLDSTCDRYQIEPIQVPRAQSMEHTVALILAEQASPSLGLSGYRVSFAPETKTVTIDLRVARDAGRVLQSLSMCEQRALLGSLRETLINQPDWQIEAVTFTNRGHALLL
ncbi:hypothetical protein [Nodosilinea sp. E11]|uniref:hypothetical protein n=1 Tax=Nodosilinea sp. E11 TaxID=3037479 RepID=UPI002934903E|nr:hypothetical protein [Nodosilinea sp. E11]WOD40191.1 hypothetical protein RRF56_05225 [Nodosilinea sp. E11]